MPRNAAEHRTRRAVPLAQPTRLLATLKDIQKLQNMKYHYRRPYMTVAHYDSTCPETGLPIRQGDEIAYYPRDRKAFHTSSQSADNVRRLDFAESYNMADANY